MTLLWLLGEKEKPHSRTTRRAFCCGAGTVLCGLVRFCLVLYCGQRNSVRHRFTPCGTVSRSITQCGTVLNLRAVRSRLAIDDTLGPYVHKLFELDELNRENLAW